MLAARAAALAVLIAASSVAALPAQRAPSRARRGRVPMVAGCPAPSAATWAAIRDSLWPQLTHRDGDQAWAHLEPDGLPEPSGTWCNPLDDNAAALDGGRQIYAQHCQACHGAAGKGDGPAAGTELPGPFDFTSPVFAGMRVAPGSGVLYAVLTRGIAGTSMRAFGELGPWERLAVLAYISQFPGDSAIGAQRAWADSLRRRRPSGP